MGQLKYARIRDSTWTGWVNTPNRYELNLQTSHELGRQQPGLEQTAINENIMTVREQPKA